MLLKKSGLKSRVKYGVLIPLFMLTSYIVLAITFNRRVTPKPNGAHTTASENQGILLQKYIAKEITLTAPPFPKTLPNLENREAWKGEITGYVHSLLEGKKNGFFIEAGANDGEFYSNTLALELLSGWTGLLVEPIPTAHTPLLAKRRNAWVANCCLSPEPKATTFKMVSHRNWGASVANIPKFFTGHGSRSDYTKSYDVRCYPLHYLLMAVGQMEVDYLSLDIEGAELSVLKTIPFDKVSIKVITVEINNGQEADVTQFLKEHGYKKMRYIKNEVAHDNVYMKNGNELPSEPNLDAIRANYLSPARWAFKRPRQQTSTNVRRTSVAKFVQKNLLKNKAFGFFVEAGANDGELNSHTLALEVFDGWTGLLVEANPQLRQMLLTKKRNVWVASCCLSTQPNDSKVEISEEKLGPAKSPCVPLHHLLNAIGQKDVDFMSLNDGAGAELSILKTIPFDKINITVISVETNEPSKDWTEIPEYLGKYGYKKMEFTTHGANALFMKVEE